MVQVDMDILDARLTTVCVAESMQSIHLQLYKIADVSYLQTDTSQTGKETDSSPLPGHETPPKHNTNITITDSNIYTDMPIAASTDNGYCKYYDHESERQIDGSILDTTSDTVSDKTEFLSMPLEEFSDKQSVASYNLSSSDCNDDILPHSNRSDTDYVQCGDASISISSPKPDCDYEGLLLMGSEEEEGGPEGIWWWDRSKVD